jgi:thiamine monophosphate synthase
MGFRTFLVFNNQRLASSEPIILLHVGESEGLVSLREDIPEPHYVVGDGNHRLLAAKRLRAILRAYVLTAEESAS